MSEDYKAFDAADEVDLAALRDGFAIEVTE